MPRNPLIDFFKRVWKKMCGALPFTRNDYNYMRAKQKLASELDITRILKTLRYLRLATKLQLSSTERHLLRMQAEPLIVDSKKFKNSELKRSVNQMTLSDILNMERASSDFSEKEDGKLFDYLAEKQLTENEVTLLTGMFCHEQPTVADYATEINASNDLTKN